MKCIYAPSVSLDNFRGGITMSEEEEWEEEEKRRKEEEEEEW